MPKSMLVREFSLCWASLVPLISGLKGAACIVQSGLHGSKLLLGSKLFARFKAACLVQSRCPIPSCCPIQRCWPWFPTRSIGCRVKVETQDPEHGTRTLVYPQPSMFG